MSSPRPEDDLSREVPTGSAIPAAVTSLIGRTRDLEGVNEALRRCRLLTVTGPGGVGKTRLATEVARRQLPRRLDGVWFVDLAAGPRTPEVATETARVFGLQAVGGTATVDALRRYLAERDALVVLDNCKHVIGQCAELTGALLRCCPHVRILATSREPLGVNGETLWRLEPLALDDAHRLFVERARQRRPEFLPDEDTEATIATLCDRLDRLPLAIELAAARMSALSPREILTLGGGFGYLSRRFGLAVDNLDEVEIVMTRRTSSVATATSLPCAGRRAGSACPDVVEVGVGIHHVVGHRRALAAVDSQERQAHSSGRVGRRQFPNRCSPRTARGWTKAFRSCADSHCSYSCSFQPQCRTRSV